MEHNVNPATDRCVMCGRNRFQRGNTPECDYVRPPTDMFGNDLTKTDSFGTPRTPPMAYVRETVPCEVCEDPTPMLGTRLCDRCWELKTRIEADPELARKILGWVEGRD